MADEFSNLPYAPWLESTIRDLVDINPTAIAMQMMDESGEIYSCYYNMSPNIRAQFIAGMQDDDRLEWVKNNRHVIADILAGEEEGEDE